MAFSNKQKFLIIMLVFKMMRQKTRRQNLVRRRITNLIILWGETNINSLLWQMQMSMMGLFQLTAMQLPSARRCRAYERHDFWFSDLWNNRGDDEYHGGDRWKKDFRMNVDTFLKLVNKLRPYLQKQDTVSLVFLIKWILKKCRS